MLRSAAEVDQSVPVAERLLARYGAGSVASLSFDKGFTRAEDRELLELYIPTVVMPKRGKKNAAETERENGKKFKALRRRHSAVESEINSLEHHGLNRCLDVGLAIPLAVPDRSKAELRGLVACAVVREQRGIRRGSVTEIQFHLAVFAVEIEAIGHRRVAQDQDELRRQVGDALHERRHRYAVVAVGQLVEFDMAVRDDRRGHDTNLLSMRY